MNALKGYLKSKTFWLNVVGGAVAVVTAMKGVVPEEYAIAALALLNIVNRALTNKSLSDK
jgi:hypothetical protein